MTEHFHAELLARRIGCGATIWGPIGLDFKQVGAPRPLSYAESVEAAKIAAKQMGWEVDRVLAVVPRQAPEQEGIT